MRKKKPIDEKLRDELLEALNTFKAETLKDGEPTNIFCYLCRTDADALRKLITWTNTDKRSKYKVGTISSLNILDKLRFTVMLAADFTESRFYSYPLGGGGVMDSIFMEDIRSGLAEEANALIGKVNKDEK